ncbi:MAG: tetratricopeptide repeat protein [Saprospiraceae bacterium]|nr:tetratricopeptide repeat protein [Saprospiraceae bacterium]
MQATAQVFQLNLNNKMKQMLYFLRFILLYCYYFLLLLLLAITAKAQNLDSLHSIWQHKTLSDSIRVAAYKDYIWNGFLFSKPDTAAVLAESLNRFATEHNYPKAAAQAYNLKGIANHLQGNYSRALENYMLALPIFEEVGDKLGYANSLNNIGNLYNNQGNYALALTYYEKSLAIKEEIGDKGGIASSLGNIGNIYKNQGNYKRALEYYEKLPAIFEKSGDKQGYANSLNNIGNIYHNQGNYPRGLEYYEKSLAIQEGLGNKKGIAYSLSNIGLIYKDQVNYSRALEYTKKALAVREEIKDKSGIASSLKNIGVIYQNQGDFQMAMKACQNALLIAEEIGVLDQQKGACQCLYETYKVMGKGNEALKYLEKMNGITDSLKAEETGKKLQQMEFAKQMLQDSIVKAEESRLIEAVHKEEVRQKNQNRNIAYGIGGMILLLSGGLYSRLRYVRKAKNIIEKEKDRSENLLLNILPAEIAAELKEKGRADARDFDLVSILFTDFKSFTETSSKLSAAELVNEINTCFETFDGIVGKYGIEKIKTIGDSYMAAGGLPVPSDRSVKNTVLAALEMQRFIAERKTMNDAIGKQAFEMRVGIHSGPVVAGIVGVKKFQYDIWGDTVNIASRFENNSDVGKVNISQSTYDLLHADQDFKFENRGKIEVKGKGEMAMYYVELV